MDCYTPNNLEELYSALKNMTNKSKIIGGGTDLGISLNKKRIEPDALLYIGNVKESKNISLKTNFLEIGASLTHTEIKNNEIIKKNFICIVDACEDIGSLQIRNSGTIGGNIGNASPAGDLIPVLYMLDALISVVSSKKILVDIPIKNFIIGPGKIKLNNDEVILKIKIPLKKNYITSFIKLGSRKKVTISRIGLCIGLNIQNEIVKKADVVVGAISLKPVILKSVEEYLINKNINRDLEEIKEKVSEMISQTIMEVTPEKYDRDYKVWASKGIVYDSLEQIKGRI